MHVSVEKDILYRKPGWKRQLGRGKCRRDVKEECESMNGTHVVQYRL